MEKVITADVWTETYANQTDMINGSFIDGFENGIPYDRIKIVNNCNCIFSSDSKQVELKNKHNLILFYLNEKVVRLAFLEKETNTSDNIDNALNQKMREGGTLLYKFLKSKIKIERINLNQKIKYKKGSNYDVCSCNRLSLLKCMLAGSFTEDKSNYGNKGNWKNVEYFPDVEIIIYAKTDTEEILIKHKGVITADIENEYKKCIAIQTESNITPNDVKRELNLRFKL